MTFPLEKILTVSAGDWIETQTRRGSTTLKNYKMVGVHIEYTEKRALFEIFDPIVPEFAKAVPKNTVVVVNYSFSISGEYGESIVASGTALIPKKKK
jgi:hypothetical protein